MPADDARCPGCGAPMTRSADHGVRYECGQCGGRLLGLSPFEQLLEDSVGARLWVASTSGSPAGPCPFCGQAMHHAAQGADSAAGILMCRTCQEVWIPSDAATWLSAHAAPGAVLPAPAAAPLPDRCVTCGAPLETDEMGRCRFCHTQLTAPDPVIVNFQEAPSTTGIKLLDAVAGLLTKPME
jgi:Zn-finger nucleic acid-binding protein